VIGEACGTYKGEEHCIYFFWWGILKETNRFEDVDMFDNIQMDPKEMG
jgi:hypothetical protein